MTLRLFAGGIATETNVFSPMPTGLHDFAASAPNDPPDVRDRVLSGATFRRYAEVASTRECTYIQGSFYFAQPAGITTRAAYEAMRDILLAEVEAALPLHAVILHLHGAMVADGYEDCETDIALRVRTLVGETAKIGVLLDLHCDIAQELVDTADLIVVFKEYPHTDIEDRAGELVSLTIDAASGAIDPTMALFDCKMLGIYPTSSEPMRSFVDAMVEAERRPGVLSVSLAHSFPWGDSVDMGARALAVTNGNPVQAEALAEEVGRRFHSLRREVSLQPLPMEDALDRAFSVFASVGGPVVVADVSDNAGGGAPSDSTYVLRELLKRGAEDAALAMMWDPIAVQQAFAAGEGAELTLRLGGKMGPQSGDPLDLTTRVTALASDLVQHWPQDHGFLTVPVGECARLTVDGVDIIVSRKRQQVLGLEVFTALGVDPLKRAVLVVKSSNHFRAAFGPIASEVIYMAAPGALTFDFPTIPYKRLNTLKYPWVNDWPDTG